MTKRRIKQAVVFVLIVCILSGCTAHKQMEQRGTSFSEEQSTKIEQSADIASDTGESVSQSNIGARPLLVSVASEGDEENVIPSVEPYTIEPDLSNVDNLWQFYLQGDIVDKLSQNGFVVCGDAGREFFEIYEMNRYELRPNFVTVDSLMHTYHLYFSYLLKNIEKDYLIEDITNLSRLMLTYSIEQYDKLKGSEWESAAARNVAFFTVGTKLLDDNTEIKDYVAEIVGNELNSINQAEGIKESEITGAFEDYTQYMPRGYYEGDENLEKYFRAMMWYGRIHFKQEEEDMDRSALLIAKALDNNSEAYKLWESIYAVTSFFAGASDDLGVCEYAPLIRKAYGEDAAIDDLIGNEAAFNEFHAMTATLSAPQINSIPIEEGDDNVILGFRFMGQRFTIDASIMQRLIYSDVEENSEGFRRMLPDVLDVPAALGSDLALAILEEEGAADYAGYLENMEKLRKSLSEENSTLWSASLYANWLNTLRPLLTVKGEGYPVFMQNEEWSKKNLECCAGSFTELKHDTILYAKQVIAEMGGGYDEEPDYRGYVEPEPLVYARFVKLTELTSQGLKEYEMLSSDAEENLSRLSQIAGWLLEIFKKELQDEVLTDEQYEFIADYGGNIEHFWYEAIKDDGGEISTQTYPAAVVADIATDPNGQVLEVATGDPSIIYVVVKVDGKIKIASGSVYSFYQFAWPLDDRLTDTKWRQMIGILPDDDGNYNYDIPVERPEWTYSYRYQYEWE